MQSVTEHLALCRADPNAFIEFVFGYTQGRVHITLQDFISKHKACSILLHRRCGKTDQLIGRVAWWIGNNPDILIKVVQENDNDASKFVVAVRSVLESDRFRMVFPEIVKDTTFWGKQAISVQRTRLSKDPTLEASGIFGSPSGRADVLIFDDICSAKNSLRSATLRNQVYEHMMNTWLPMLTDGGQVISVATPWHVEDAVAKWTNKKGVAVLKMPCDGTRYSPWHEHWTANKLEWMRQIMGDIAYARAFLLQPLTGEELVFGESHLIGNLYDPTTLPDENETTTIIAVDLAFRQPRGNADLSDPDWTVAIAARITNTGDAYPFRIYRDRVSFPIAAAAIKEMVRQTNPSVVVTEEVGGAMQELNNQLEIVCGIPLTRVHRSHDKYTRAVSVQSKVINGNLHLPGTDGQIRADFVPVYDEMTQFPVGNHDDCVDAIVDILSYARTFVAAHSATKVRDPFNVGYIISQHEQVEEEIARKNRYAYGRVCAGWDDKD